MNDLKTEYEKDIQYHGLPTVLQKLMQAYRQSMIGSVFYNSDDDFRLQVDSDLAEFDRFRDVISKNYRERCAK